MMEVKVLILELDSSSGIGNELRSVLKSAREPAIQVRLRVVGPEPINRSMWPVCVEDLSPDAVFLVSSPADSERTRADITGVMELFPRIPIMLVLPENGPDELPDSVIEFLKLGIADYLIPPLRSSDVLPRLWRLLGNRGQGKTLLGVLEKTMGMRQLIGKSPAFLAQAEKIPEVAGCDANVLITGQTGTGKELFARAIHYMSPRAKNAFIPAGCGMIPHELAENELFGHVQGAFTGANQPRSGLIQEADGGTLFLDEIDCLPWPTQAKLLRFLQEREYKQLGSPKIRHADVRVIAATNLDLSKEMTKGTFRRDLFYRLHVIALSIPPLRERREDIPLLAAHFIEKYGIRFNKHYQGITPEGICKLKNYAWPGNVRELENIVERAVIFAKGPRISETDIDLPACIREPAAESFKAAKARVVEQFEKNYIQDILLAYNGNISRAAQAVQKNRRAFWELIRRYNIDVENIKGEKTPQAATE